MSLSKISETDPCDEAETLPGEKLRDTVGRLFKGLGLDAGRTLKDYMVFRVVHIREQNSTTHKFVPTHWDYEARKFDDIALMRKGC